MDPSSRALTNLNVSSALDGVPSTSQTRPHLPDTGCSESTFFIGLYHILNTCKRFGLNKELDASHPETKLGLESMNSSPVSWKALREAGLSQGAQLLCHPSGLCHFFRTLL